MPIAVCSHLGHGLLMALFFLSVSNAWGQAYKTFNTATAYFSGVAKNVVVLVALLLLGFSNVFAQCLLIKQFI
jgi:hypothetical protein